MMMNNSAPTHKRRKLVKTYKKNVLPKKRTVVAKVCGENYSKKKKKKTRGQRPNESQKAVIIDMM